MYATRERILEYLSKNNFASAIEMSRNFKMTSANLRHHLNILIESGAIKVVSKRKIALRGRPTSIYMLNHDNQHNNLSILTSALLNLVLGSKKSVARMNRLHQLVKHILPKQVNASQTFSYRLGHTIDSLVEMNYSAHWEAHATGARIIFNHCPYAEIIADHPELCEMDNMMLSKLVGKSVYQTSKIAFHPAGPHQCRFIVVNSRNID